MMMIRRQIRQNGIFTLGWTIKRTHCCFLELFCTLSEHDAGPASFQCCAKALDVIKVSRGFVECQCKLQCYLLPVDSTVWPHKPVLSISMESRPISVIAMRRIKHCPFDNSAVETWHPESKAQWLTLCFAPKPNTFGCWGCQWAPPCLVTGRWSSHLISHLHRWMKLLQSELWLSSLKKAWLKNTIQMRLETTQCSWCVISQGVR